MSEFGDLLELMYSARGRWQNVQLTLRDWSHHERSRKAFERFHERMEKRGGKTFRVSACTPGPAKPQPETSERMTRVWLDGDRNRHESDGRIVVHVGDTWWMTSPHKEPMTNGGDKTQGVGREDVASLLDPATLIGVLELEPRGETEVARRPGIVVHAVPREGDHVGPGILYLLRGDELELVVDRERGVVLRQTAFIDGEPYQVREIEEIAFDEAFPDEVFRIELPPGQTWSKAGRGPRIEALTLPQAVARASFKLFVPGRLADGWRFRNAINFRAADEPERWEAVDLRYRHDQGAHEFSVYETSHPHLWLGSDALRTVERDDVVMKVIEPSEKDAPMPVQVLVERDGTPFTVSSQDLPLDELIQIAVSVVPASDSPPPAVER